MLQSSLIVIDFGSQLKLGCKAGNRRLGCRVLRFFLFDWNESVLGEILMVLSRFNLLEDLLRSLVLFVLQLLVLELEYVNFA